MPWAGRGRRWQLNGGSSCTYQHLETIGGKSSPAVIAEMWLGASWARYRHKPCPWLYPAFKHWRTEYQLPLSHLLWCHRAPSCTIQLYIAQLVIEPLLYLTVCSVLGTYFKSARLRRTSVFTQWKKPWCQGVVLNWAALRCHLAEGTAVMFVFFAEQPYFLLRINAHWGTGCRVCKRQRAARLLTCVWAAGWTPSALLPSFADGLLSWRSSCSSCCSCTNTNLCLWMQCQKR